MMKDASVKREIYWYYLRTADHHPYGTVALYKEKTNEKWTYHRGIAFCSENDRFEKRTGRNMAIGRLMKAIKNATSSMPSYYQKAVSLPSTERFYNSNEELLDLDYCYLSEYDCKNISEFEMRIMFRPDEDRS